MRRLAIRVRELLDLLIITSFKLDTCTTQQQ